jgi:hypothetical protein
MTGLVRVERPSGTANGRNRDSHGTEAWTRSRAVGRAEVTIWTLIVAMIVCPGLSGCVERVAEPEDVFGAIRRGDMYSPASKMIDSWYAAEAIDGQAFAINEPKSSQDNTFF